MGVARTFYVVDHLDLLCAADLAGLFGSRRRIGLNVRKFPVSSNVGEV